MKSVIYNILLCNRFVVVVVIVVVSFGVTKLKAESLLFFFTFDLFEKNAFLCSFFYLFKNMVWWEEKKPVGSHYFSL